MVPFCQFFTFGVVASIEIIDSMLLVERSAPESATRPGVERS